MYTPIVPLPLVPALSLSLATPVREGTELLSCIWQDTGCCMRQEPAQRWPLAAGLTEILKSECPSIKSLEVIFFENFVPSNPDAEKADTASGAASMRTASFAGAGFVV